MAVQNSRLEGRVTATVEARMATLQETFLQSLKTEMEGHLVTQVAQFPTAFGVELIGKVISSLSLTLQKTHT